MKKRDELWWAYLDGEMSAAESASFDRSLGSEDRDTMAADIEMEAELRDVLAAPVACPKATWKNALALVKQEQRSKSRLSPWLRRTLWVAAPLAAAIIISVVAFFPEAEAPKPLFLVFHGEDISAVAAKSQVTDGVTGVRIFMEQLALPVALNPADALDGQNASYRLLGAREDAFHGERVVQLMFDCDSQPAILVIAPNGGFAAQEIGKGLLSGTVRACRSFSNVVVAVVGATAPRDLIRVVDDDWPVPEVAPSQANEAPQDASDSDAAAPVEQTAPEVPPPDQPVPTEPVQAPEITPPLDSVPDIVATLV